MGWQTTRHLANRYLTLVAALLLLAPAMAMAEPPADQAEQIVEREARFIALLSGATLRGHFTVTGNEPDGQPPRLRTEQYDLVEVRKVDEQHWLFKARIRYGDHDVTLPMTLPVEWAGDTPVVVVDNLGFPGLGTYSARVLFHDDHYAGYWSGTDRGGHLFGTIERPEPPATPPTGE